MTDDTISIRNVGNFQADSMKLSKFNRISNATNNLVEFSTRLQELGELPRKCPIGLQLQLY